MQRFPHKNLAKQLNLTVFALLAGSLVSGCSETQKDEVGTPPATPVATLRLQTIHAETREIQESIVGTGSIGAAQSSNIGVVTPGIVERIFVKVPYDGVVTSRNVDEGTYKSAQTFSADGSVLQLKEIRIVVALVRVPEIYVTNLRLGTGRCSGSVG